MRKPLFIRVSGFKNYKKKSTINDLQCKNAQI